MSAEQTTRPRRDLRFLLGFALLVAVVAGGLSYLADPNPDGLDSVIRQGCTASGEKLSGQCIAQSATEHPLAGSPLAEYQIAGQKETTGVAGILGATATLVVAGGVFWLLRRRPSASAED